MIKDNLISDTLHKIGQEVKNASVVQIGACDGIVYDDTRGFLDLYNWKGVFVEPIPELFEQLKENFKDRDYKFVNAAITDKTGDVIMLNVPDSKIAESELRPCFKGMSSVWPPKNGLGSDDEYDTNVRENFAEKITVRSLNLIDMFKETETTEFDVFIVDAEGCDYDIFMQLDLDKFHPKFIRLETCNLTDDERLDIRLKLDEAGYCYEIDASEQNIDATLKSFFNPFEEDTFKSDLPTIVTGLWDINRHNRSFDHYIEAFERMLAIPLPMIVYVPAELEDFVWQSRDASNTFVRVFNLDDVGNMYEPFWDKTQEIRQQDEWINRAGWLSDSPQCKLEWYNAIVQSKMFMLNDASIIDPFGSDYFYWLDAGITTTVPEGHLVSDNVLAKLANLTVEDEFLFVSFPYDASNEIHGFEYPAINDYAGEDVKYVCRGGLFGGHKTALARVNGEYYHMLNNTLSDGYMGTEESIFSILAHADPYTYRRFAIEGNGLIVTFTEALRTDTAKLVELDANFVKRRYDVKKVTPNKVTDKVKTNVYILTFNMPEQLLHTLKTMLKTEGLMTHPDIFLFDNSTDPDAMVENYDIATQYGIEYIPMGKNIGICGGRQAIAEHFDKTDADYMIFFEDDMTFNGVDNDGEVCRNGFRKYIPNIYETIHKIMYLEEFDYLKLSFTEVYFDNDKQCAWYNVPQDIREKYWPDYCDLPKLGLDPNCPKTQFGELSNIDELSYMTGDVYYSNWPLIVSKAGNYKMFIKDALDHPYEQTWMSQMFQKQKEGQLKTAILLASPIWHDRIKFYKAEERVES